MEQKKTIIFKISEFPHVSETFIVNHIMSTIKMGYDVKILVNKLILSNFDSYQSIFEKYELSEKIYLENYEIPKNKLVKIFKWFYLLLINISSISSIYAFLKTQKKFSFSTLYQWCFFQKFNNKNTIFHIQYGTNKHPIDLLKVTGNFKPSVIVTFHGHDAFFPINGFIPNNGYYDMLFNTSNLITANTPYLANQLIKIGCLENKIVIVPVGVDTSFFKPTPEELFSKEKLKIITVGRLDSGKGHVYGIEIIRRLVSDGIPVQFNIVGEGKEFQKLQNQIQTNDLQEHVFLLGKKNQKEIRDLLRQHDLYLLTAVAMEGGRRETQGLATIEAQACGLPAVVFDSGGVKYTVEDGVTGYVCEEYNTDEVVAKIKTLYNDAILLREMSKNSQKFVQEHYSLFSVEKKWEIIYKNIFN